jgi:hypothetical protein
MAKLATFIVGAVVGGILGVVGVVATLGTLSPSAEHVANQTTIDPATTVYGVR